MTRPVASGSRAVQRTRRKCNSARSIVATEGPATPYSCWLSASTLLRQQHSKRLKNNSVIAPLCRGPGPEKTSPSRITARDGRLQLRQAPQAGRASLVVSPHLAQTGWGASQAVSEAAAAAATGARASSIINSGAAAMAASQATTVGLAKKLSPRSTVLIRGCGQRRRVARPNVPPLSSIPPTLV